MRWLKALQQRPDSAARPQSAGLSAEAAIERLQRIADLQTRAEHAIESAEATLDASLKACPTLDEKGCGTLGRLRPSKSA